MEAVDDLGPEGGELGVGVAEAQLAALGLDGAGQRRHGAGDALAPVVAIVIPRLYRGGGLIVAHHLGVQQALGVAQVGVEHGLAKVAGFDGLEEIGARRRLAPRGW